MALPCICTLVVPPRTVKHTAICTPNLAPLQPLTSSALRYLLHALLPGTPTAPLPIASPSSSTTTFAPVLRRCVLLATPTARLAWPPSPPPHLMSLLTFSPYLPLLPCCWLPQLRQDLRTPDLDIIMAVMATWDRSIVFPFIDIIREQQQALQMHRLIKVSQRGGGDNRGEGGGWG